MEEIKNIIIKHFGFLPEIISTTEHVYVSPPSRVISSLFELSKFSQKKILRIIIEDKTKLDNSNNLRIFLPHLSNKNLFILNFSNKEDLLIDFNKNLNILNLLLDQQHVFSLEEKNNYLDLINIYKQTFINLNEYSVTNFYNVFLKIYLEYISLKSISDWVQFTPFVSVDSFKMKNFIKDSFLYLYNHDLDSLKKLGFYLENKNKLRIINTEGMVTNVKWEIYISYIFGNSYNYYVPFEISLFLFSYWDISHFGNDYKFSKELLKLNSNSRLIQLTEHNKDFSFNIELSEINFNRAFLFKDKWNLSHRIYKNVNTLPELHILLGREHLQKIFKDHIIKNK